MFNEIQGRVWPELARRLFGGARVYQVAPELGVQVDLFSVPELWALHGGSLMMGLVPGVAAGGAGFRSQMALSMIPAASSLFVLEKLILTTATQDNLLLAWSSTELTASTGNLVGRDTRRFTTAGGSAPAGARLRTQNNAAIANIASNVAQFIVPANTVTVIPLEVVIGPGWSLRIVQTADNTAINTSVTWVGRERSVTVDELAVL